MHSHSYVQQSAASHLQFVTTSFSFQYSTAKVYFERNDISDSVEEIILLPIMCSLCTSVGERASVCCRRYRVPSHMTFTWICGKDADWLERYVQDGRTNQVAALDK